MKSTGFCEHCNEPVISTIAEPEGKTITFDTITRVAWKMVQVTAEHTVAAPIEVYDLHRLTCKAINNKQ